MEYEDKELESCVRCENYLPYKCGRSKDGSDNTVMCCSLDRCPYGKFDN